MRKNANVVEDQTKNQNMEQSQLEMIVQQMILMMWIDDMVIKMIESQKTMEK